MHQTISRALGWHPPQHHQGLKSVGQAILPADWLSSDSSRPKGGLSPYKLIPNVTAMKTLSAANAVEYLQNRGMELTAPRVTELGGGVSNTVLLVESDGQAFVLKQSLGKLRVQEDWFACRERVVREAAALQRLADRLPQGSIPAVLFEDRENFLYAMSAAPPDSTPWKDLLLNGDICFRYGVCRRFASGADRERHLARRFVRERIRRSDRLRSIAARSLLPLHRRQASRSRIPCRPVDRIDIPSQGQPHPWRLESKESPGGARQGDGHRF